MEKGNLYFIKDEYFDKFPNQKLLTNKELHGNYNMNRPCYYAFPDDECTEICWMIPISSRIDKLKIKYQKSIQKYGKCDVLVFGYVKGNENVFCLQNMCPITSKYIMNEYLDVNTQKPIKISSDTKREINAKARKIIRLHKKGINLAHADIMYMKEVLLKEITENLL